MVYHTTEWLYNSMGYNCLYNITYYCYQCWQYLNIIVQLLFIQPSPLHIKCLCSQTILLCYWSSKCNSAIDLYRVVGGICWDYGSGISDNDGKCWLLISGWNLLVVDKWMEFVGVK